MTVGFVDRIADRYGVLGVFVLWLCVSTLFFVWIVLSLLLIWPVLLPFVAAAYMAMRIWGE